METFYAVARFRGEGRTLQFTLVTTWEAILAEIRERWSLEASSRLLVKFVTPDAYGTICPIESEADFQRMCHIHAIFKKNNVDMIVEELSGEADEGNSFEQM